MVATLLDELKKQLPDLTIHLYVARWQQQKFQMSVLLMCNDFAENYRTSYQDEIQSTHWNYSQVTLHPTIVY